MKPENLPYEPGMAEEGTCHMPLHANSGIHSDGRTNFQILSLAQLRTGLLFHIPFYYHKCFLVGKISTKANLCKIPLFKNCIRAGVEAW